MEYIQEVQQQYRVWISGNHSTYKEHIITKLYIKRKE